MTLTAEERHQVRQARRRDDAFDRVVNLDLREELDPTRAAWLRRRHVVVDWLRELVHIQESLRYQLGERRRLLQAQPYHPCQNGGRTSPEWEEVRREHDMWCARIARLERAVADRILEAKNLCAYYGLTYDNAEWTLILAKLDELLKTGEVDSARRLVTTALRYAADRGADQGAEP